MQNMTEMLVELIQNFISGSETTLNSVFSSMLNLVFHIERELSNLKVADGSFIDFNAIYQTIFNYAIYILVIVFIAKAIKIYFFMHDGDPEQNPIQLAIGMVKAVIVMICFKEIYDIFVGIVQEFLNNILNHLTLQGTNLAEMLSNNMGGGIFTAVACLVLLIVWLILICQFIMKGIEILVMRLGIPFASIRSFKFRQWSIFRIYKGLSTYCIYISSTTCITKFINIITCKWSSNLWHSNCDSIC